MPREIPLTRGLVTLVDEDDWGRFGRLRWTASRGGRTWYATRAINRGGRTQHVLLHRAILGVGPGVQVDHKDRNGLNNTRDNLRRATRSQNQQNAAKQSRRTRSQFKGVCWSTSARKWVAYIKLDGHQRHLGSFDAEVDAARAYDAAAKAAFGAFARLNLEECS